jgi:hypothetical protein
MSAGNECRVRYMKTFLVCTAVLATLPYPPMVR